MNTVTVNTKGVIQAFTPSKVVCIGRNYIDHIKELGNEMPDEMVVFMKPNSAISTTLSATHSCEPLHYEGELCFLYYEGRFSAIGFGLDLTKRMLQSKLKEKGLPWDRAKAFDGAAVLSDFIAIENTTDNFTLSLMINNHVKQSGGTSLMMYKPDTILKAIQEFTTLEDGDIVMTGTPKGVGVINCGDHFKAQVFLDNKDKSKDQNKEKIVLLNREWLAQ